MHRHIELQIKSLFFTRGQGPSPEPILLRDPGTDADIDQAQWVNGGRKQPVAYVKGTTAKVEVGIEVEWFAFEDFDLSAYGSFHDQSSQPAEPGTPIVGPVRVQLSSDDRHQRFVKVGPLKLNVPLPDTIGRHTLSLDWYADERTAGNPVRLFLGHTELTVCTTWKPMVDSPADYLEPWAYSTVMEWSCAWARGANTPKGICDQLMAMLPASGLQYGFPAWTIRAMLSCGGGMCGGWYQLFAQIANCQGVALSQQTMMLPAGDAEPWTNLVVKAPGINQRWPSFPVGLTGHYRDSDQPEPITERRYRFFQDNDGHSFDMLDNKDRTVTIYDPSFWRSASSVQMKVPPQKGRVDTFKVSDPFRTEYFHKAIYTLTEKRAPGQGQGDPLDFGVNKRCAAIGADIMVVWNYDPRRHVTVLLQKLQRVLATYFDGEDSAELQRLLGVSDGGKGLKPGAVPDALRRAGALAPRPDAPLPHTMPPAELLQYALLELSASVPLARRELRRTTLATSELERLAAQAASPRLRALAGRMLKGGPAGARSQRGRGPRAR